MASDDECVLDEAIDCEALVAISKARKFGLRLDHADGLGTSYEGCKPPAAPVVFRTLLLQFAGRRAALDAVGAG